MMTWMDALERLFDMGSPMVILAALLYLLARGGRWLGVHFLCPIKTQVVDFLRRLADSVAKLQSSLDALIEDVQQFRCRYSEPPTAQHRPRPARTAGPPEGG